MRVAKMGYTQRVTKKDKKGRITSSFVRVRIVVPDGLSPSLPPPYTGNKNLTKKTSSDCEAAEWTARFLAMIEQAAGRTSAMQELARLDTLEYPTLIQQAPAVFRRFFRTVNLPVPASEIPAEPVTFESMIPKWAKHTNAPKKGIGDMKTGCRMFAECLKHDNMSRVTFEDGRDWRDEMIETAEVSPQTISNRLKAVKALFAYVYDNDHIKDRGNPMARVKFSPGDCEEREDFTPEERRKILLAAREAPEHIYWLSWLGSFTAARLSELADAYCRDIVCEFGVWVIKFRRKYRSPDQRLKTKVSIRDVPLHSALLTEGFLDYVDKIRVQYGDGAPLFPNLRLDGYGRRSGQASSDLSDWHRNTVKVSGKTWYSHRHTGISYLRNTLSEDGVTPLVKEAIERHLTGHAKKGAHAGYGKRWIETLKAAIEVIPNPLDGKAIPKSAA